MSWPISGAAALALAALVMGCERPPASQSAGVSRAPLWLPTQMARSPRRQVQLASAAAVSDYDLDLSRPKDIAMEPAPISAAPTIDEQPYVELALGPGVSSVLYGPAQSSVPPAGMLSITQVVLGSAASTRDTATDAIDALARRLNQGLRGWSAEPQK